MSDFNIEFDPSEALAGLDRLDKQLSKIMRRVLEPLADTLLMLSREEVPHDTGNLQASGHTDWDGESALVAYNTVYAMYQHEGMRRDGTHVIRHYQKGRKKKYLEDPLKMNMSLWQKMVNEEFVKALNSI